MTTVEGITAAIAAPPPEQVARVRAWLDGWGEAAWDAQVEQDERAGRLDDPADRAPGTRVARASIDQGMRAKIALTPGHCGL